MLILINLPLKLQNSDISRQCFILDLKKHCFLIMPTRNRLFRGRFANLQIYWSID